DTLRALEEALLEFPGCAVVITHDRWFLDRVATHILAFEGDSQINWFEGNYADYEADRRRRLGTEADQPHRIRYTPCARSGAGSDSSPCRLSGRHHGPGALPVFPRNIAISPWTCPPLRWITAANSERCVTAMLMPSTATSLILYVPC